MLRVLDCLDSDELAATRRAELLIPRDVAARLGRTAVLASHVGHYTLADGSQVDWRDLVDRARAARVSVPPDAALPTPNGRRFDVTDVQA